MMTEKFAIAIMIGSPNSTIKLVSTTIESIRNCLKSDTYRFIIQIGPKVNEEVSNYVTKMARDYSFFTIMGHQDLDWAVFINNAIQVAQGCTYFIKSHDDIELFSSDFEEKIDLLFSESKFALGWVSFTDIGYTFGDYSPAVRPGYFLDVIHENSFSNMQIYQFHKFKKLWAFAPRIQDIIYKIGKKIRKYFKLKLKPYPKQIKRISKYELDLPKRPVRCHAPFNHFVLIKYDNLIDIGPCENWGTKNALFVDEDWGLRASLKNYYNVWVPDLFYFHNRGIYGDWTRSNQQISQDVKRVSELFKDKWGFNGTPNATDLEYIKNKYADTLIVWSFDRYSYDWDYIVEKW